MIEIDIGKYLKGCIKSFTIWFNSVIAGLAVFLPELVAFLPSIQNHLPEDPYKFISLVALTGNFILRFKTNNGLDQK